MSNDPSGDLDELSSGGSRYHQVYPTLSDAHDRAEVLRIIAITARGALLDALRPDPGYAPGADHDRETP